ncbi:gamma-glutamylcyclotransferase [Aureimonas fodinaquatilis]|uniref:glutathione-specific gamma-glutamylcyclotransferase n=1 Tax=Aureimonas fodinaquatilis TaxID=2565783 RepID=A0A5B0DYN0_9HYPH|nr:gamma-glutamylcyclotransferase [Aureimonas fodinaquatilis]KAA0971586.1 gamma-glutamylcyclotransferase [Aureimonas fodinaquatilis]
MTDLWVFGYGSLIWHPGFEFQEQFQARLSGYHRSLCIRSCVHRGTPEKPGLVFGLDKGGSCVGMAFRVQPENSEATIAYLRGRELVTNVYRETVQAVRLHDGRTVHALTYIADRGHSQYAGRLAPDEAASLVARSHGQSGPNVDYVVSVYHEITRMGLKDSWLEQVVSLLPHGAHLAHE